MSAADHFQIDYRFVPAQGRPVVFELCFDNRVRLLAAADPAPPDWTALENHRCPNCPLDPETNSRCPAALALVPLVAEFDSLLSHDHVRLEVETAERIISRETTIQRAVSSLMGLLMAASGCPRTTFFRPMARFHLPLASEEETIYRAAATYLLTQYFQRHRPGFSPDFALEGLNEIYRHIQQVNRAMAQRLRGASRSDSSVNAIILLDMYAKAMPYAIKQALDELAAFFTEQVEA